ncbi:MAG: orotidine-5'-phosphate decarboxylase [Nitrospiraceae bacterium]|nr:orotidine-5'-phosphate decarboxylase [Nitrospiraceae bacterium]|tara:strand:+ start:266 stop:997 length:732 start_codon:yes stop_codon:yes gene_type:complete
MARALISPQDRLIVALDVTKRNEAFRLIEKLDGLVSFYKVGWALFFAEGPAIVSEIMQRGLTVFLDLKIPDDIPDQIRRTISYATGAGVRFVTMSAMGTTLRVAKEAKGESRLQLLSVTVLTSLNEQDLHTLGMIGPDRPQRTLDDFIVWKAKYSLAHGSDGLICSGDSVAMLRDHVGKDPIIVCPGIRPQGVDHDDQKRVVSPAEAIKNGADYLVVGRPIKNAHDPRAIAANICEDIDHALG